MFQQIIFASFRSPLLSNQNSVTVPQSCLLWHMHIASSCILHRSTSVYGNEYSTAAPNSHGSFRSNIRMHHWEWYSHYCDFSVSIPSGSKQCATPGVMKSLLWFQCQYSHRLETVRTTGSDTVTTVISVSVFPAARNSAHHREWYSHYCDFSVSIPSGSKQCAPPGVIKSLLWFQHQYSHRLETVRTTGSDTVTTVISASVFLAARNSAHHREWYSHYCDFSVSIPSGSKQCAPPGVIQSLLWFKHQYSQWLNTACTTGSDTVTAVI